MQQVGVFDSLESVPLGIPPADLNFVSSEVLKQITDDVILGLCFEVHRAVKLDILFLDEPKEDEKKYEISDEIGLDIFGQSSSQKQFVCVCPNCLHSFAASYFAPHLAKCMGMGRSSSRLANKRIAYCGKIESDIEDNYSDLNYNTKNSGKRKQGKNSPGKASKLRGKNAAKIKQGKNSSGKASKLRGKNGDATSASYRDNNLLSSYEVMTVEDRKAILLQMCGVVSEHTKKMCTRSHRCPQHTDEQRRYLRDELLGRNGSLDTDDVHVDVDTVEEEVHTSRLWDSANPSPADSVTSNDTSSVTMKKKDKKVSVPQNSHNDKPSKKSKSKLTQNFGGSNQHSPGLGSSDVI